MEKQTVILIDCGGGIKRKTDIACTLLARDYKGVNNHGFNGVIEVRSGKDNCGDARPS